MKNYDRVIKNKLHDYMGLIFEKMCREYLLLYAEDLPFEISDVGQWWGTDPIGKKEIQIDIVCTPIKDDNAKKEFLIGSCKFKNEKIGVDELELLKHYSAVFGKGDRYHYYIFSLGGFTEGLITAQQRGEVKLVLLEDMYRSRA